MIPDPLSCTRQEKELSLEVKELPDAIVELWNSKSELPPVRGISPSRLKTLRARLKDKCFLNGWREAIDRICASHFATGKNDKGWKLDFDFFIRPDSVLKILEGKYDDRNGHRSCL